MAGTVLAWLLTHYLGHFLRQRARAVEQRLGLPPGNVTLYLDPDAALALVYLHWQLLKRRLL